MSIPLIQEATKDAINTSIIAIKRNIERINMLLGLMDSGSPDLSGLATKQELEDAVNSLQPVDEVTVGNMHSVSSNAVAEMFSNPLSNEFTISTGDKTANVTGILYLGIVKSNTVTTIIREDNVALVGSDLYSSGSAVSSFTILIRKGHSYKIDGNVASIYFQKFVKLF